MLMLKHLYVAPNAVLHDFSDEVNVLCNSFDAGGFDALIESEDSSWEQIN